VRRAAAVAALFLLVAASATEAPFRTPAVADLASLPELRFGERILQASSRDPTGLNDDGFNSSVTGLRKIGNETVLLEDAGPGCVLRIWMTKIGGIGTLRFYFDGETAPRLAISPRDLFAGRVPEFPGTLIGSAASSSGGYVSYVPLPFAKRLRITATGSVHFYQVTYARYAAGTEVRSFERGDRPPPVPPTPPTSLLRADATIAPGGAREVLAVKGAGTMRRLAVTIDPDDPDALTKVRVRLAFDGADAPSVDLPLGDLFAVTDPGARNVSLAAGRDAGGVFYTRFPMPLRRGARIAIASGLPRPIRVGVEVDLDPVPPGPRDGTFAAAAAGDNATRSGRDYEIVAATGAGKLVGLLLSMVGPEGGSYLEGDERIYVDASRTPAVQGTGTEDLFNAGWYFERGAFSLPLHGCLLRRTIAPRRERSDAYRWYVPDAVPFFGGLRMSLEHDGRSVVAGDSYRSVAFLYRVPGEPFVLTDRLDIGFAESGRRHGYEAVGATPQGDDLFFYAGAADKVPFADAGTHVARRSRFVVAVRPDNQGVRLRRRLDYGVPDQEAVVFVDGKPVGTWLDAGANPFKRWRESDFDIGPRFTRGKSRLEITLVNQARSPWTEYAYWVYCFVDPGR
jgi:hypothetical protein